MPKKRKRGSGLHCRKKHYRPGNIFIKIRNKCTEQNVNSHFTLTDSNSNIDIDFFDVTEF